MNYRIANRLAAAAIGLTLIASGCGKKSEYSHSTFFLGAFPKYSGWAVGLAEGGFGVIWRTTDNGATWRRQGSAQTIPNADLYCVNALDSQTAWIVGTPSDGYSTILRTDDGGKTWTRQGSAATLPNMALFKMSAVNRKVAWAVGELGAILYTSDGGDKWTLQGVGQVPDTHLQGVHAINPDVAWVTGQTDSDYATVLLTVDAGKTWTRLGSTADIPNHYLIGVSTADNKSVWAVGNGPTIVHSADGGKTWTVQMGESGGFAFDANEVVALDSKTAWVVMDNGGIHYTTDGGNTFIKQDAQAAGFILLSVTTPNAHTLWIVGRDFQGRNAGVILNSNDAGATWINQTPPGTTSLMGVTMMP